jgi:hypothetical protein
MGRRNGDLGGQRSETRPIHWQGKWWSRHILTARLQNLYTEKFIIVRNIAYPPYHARNTRWPSQRLDCAGLKLEVRLQASSRHGLHWEDPICSVKNMTQPVTGNLGTREQSHARSLQQRSVAALRWQYDVTPQGVEGTGKYVTCIRYVTHSNVSEDQRWRHGDYARKTGSNNAEVVPVHMKITSGK